MEICNSYSSSSVDSTKHSASESSVNLSLSLTFPSTSPQRATKQDWPPIKPRLRDTLKVRRRLLQRDYDTCLFVKVYMEGVPIGRKLDLSTFSGYESLLESLSQMFNTSIICGNHRDRKHHVLTYQDTDGDWMMVGDIPWEMFLETVRRLKITKPEGC
ncbi:hypothetical protein HID58_053948 [Brassica napus]|uniref:Auxin-responsive protein n=3 Tax=Brassica TaxID=3705 RepID=A0ABQ8AG56_BRANA|nr:PREDICTED: auxin-responsive protein IAA31-like [Brassica oleracea var. oleracea]XP_013681914.1 auxin-responsive protein IAA31 [Brassica napus]KAH0891519.1 hypothetical protein HID58_053948 [Brassica napus]CDY71609.1 BnaCnng73640D [Brassica napus]